MDSTEIKKVHLLPPRATFQKVFMMSVTLAADWLQFSGGLFDILDFKLLLSLYKKGDGLTEDFKEIKNSVTSWWTADRGESQLQENTVTAVTCGPNLTFTPMSCPAEQSPVAPEAASPEKHWKLGKFQSAAPSHQRALSCQGQWRSRNTQRADEGEMI